MLVTLLKRELHQSTNEGNSGCMKRLADLLENIRETPVGGGVKTVQNGRFKNRFVFRGIHAGSMRSFMR